MKTPNFGRGWKSTEIQKHQQKLLVKKEKQKKGKFEKNGERIFRKI